MKCTNNTDGDSLFSEREWARINLREKQEQRKMLRLGAVLFLLVLLTALMSWMTYYFVFRSHDYELTRPFINSDRVFGVSTGAQLSQTSRSFAADLCVSDSDVNKDYLFLDAYEAALFDLSNNEVSYAKDIFTTRSPASLTKIMTALVALKYGNIDDVVTVTSTALDIEYGSSVCDIKPGDRISLKQLVYGLMIASGNDAAMMIAEHVGGSVSSFVDMMNQEALSLGATRTHFSNPHGLTDSEHYTCAYDIYLMFSEAMKYDMFLDIINRKNYYAEYMRGDGSPVAVTWESTNHYFTGDAETPQNVIIYGGKTGTTEDAGACLALLSKDLYGDPYLSVIMHSETKDTLYLEMNQLLSLITN